MSINHSGACKFSGAIIRAGFDCELVKIAIRILDMVPGGLRAIVVANDSKASFSSP